MLVAVAVVGVASDDQEERWRSGDCTDDVDADDVEEEDDAFRLQNMRVIVVVAAMLGR